MNDEWQILVDAYFEGTASPEMLAELDRALLEDEDFRVRFLQNANLIDELSQVLSGEVSGDELPAAPRRSVRPPSWQLLALAASVAFTLGAFFYLFRTLTNHYAPGDLPTSLMLVEGQAQFEGESLSVGVRFDPPGRLVAQGNAMARFGYPDGSRLTLEEGAALHLEATASKRLFLEQGALRADIQPQPPGGEMTMETLNSKVTVLGTRFRLATAIAEDLLEVKHGRVRLEEKATGEERIAERGEPHAVPGIARNDFRISFPIAPSGTVPTGPPAESYELRRWWFTEDFEPKWIGGLWEVAEHDSEVFKPLIKPGQDYALELASRNGATTNVLRLSRPAGAGPAVRLRLRETVGWDSFFMQFLYQSFGDEPFDMRPLCLDYPAGTELETIYEQGGPEPLVAPGAWNHVRIEYLRFREGNQWQIEARRHLNGAHRSTTRLNIGSTPPLLFELKSGACILDQISVGELRPVNETPSGANREPRLFQPKL